VAVVENVEQTKKETMSQFTWAKEDRHKLTGKKKIGSKAEIKVVYGKSPDLADAAAICFAEVVTERRPEHDSFQTEDYNSGPMVRNDDYNPNELLDNQYNAR
jgi:hypothetical protein